MCFNAYLICALCKYRLQNAVGMFEFSGYCHSRNNSGCNILYRRCDNSDDSNSDSSSGNSKDGKAAALALSP